MTPRPPSRRPGTRTVRTATTASAVAGTLVLGALLAAAPADAVPVPRPPQATDHTSSVGSAIAAPPATGVRVGTLTLTPCKVAARALCGSVTRSWDAHDATQGTLQVGFAFIPAKNTRKPARGTVVAHEGGPGYSTTASASYYVQAYRPLLKRRNLLLVDQRGTGRSEPLNCPALQSYTGSYADGVKACGEQVGTHSDDYGTAPSADDQAAIVSALRLGKVDVYGDSYGTFFSQVYAGRHPDQVRSLALDGAYPTYGEDAWYPTTPATARRAYPAVCRRSAPCAEAKGKPIALLRKVLAQVRQTPWHGISYDAEGRRKTVTVDGSALVDVTYAAGYGDTNYRELTAALRGALRGDRAPLLRLVAENVDLFTDPNEVSAPKDYSEGEYVAVSCQDYPQLFDMSATPTQRLAQLEAAIAAKKLSDPGVYAPFTIDEFRGAEWSALDMCLQWPAPTVDNPAGPPTPPAGSYARMPTLVLSGELDTVTTPTEGRMITRQIPGSRQVRVRNSFHVTAISDTDDCAVRILRAFTRHPHRTVKGGCARHVPPVRALGTFPTEVRDAAVAQDLIGNASRKARRAATVAALTAVDPTGRWLNNYDGSGVGLYGGTWSYTGDARTTFTLDRYRFAKDLAVSGKVTWQRYRRSMTVDLRLRGAVHGHLTGSWDTRANGATAILFGRLDGRTAAFRLPAP